MELMISCRMGANKMAMLGVSARKIKTLTVTMQTVTLMGKCRQNVTCLVYYIYEFNNKIFFYILFLGSHFRFG